MQTIDSVDRPTDIPAIADVSRALEAVCNELGIARFEKKRREAVAKRIEAAWRTGRREPLYLVDAGLGGMHG